MSPNLAKFILARPFGFITDDDRRELLELDRLCPLVVRCGCCRFICGAQDLQTLLAYVKAGGDYCRDVSIHPETIKAARATMAATIAAMKPAPMKWAGKVREPSSRERGMDNYFNEADCGGAFDGNQVIRDADPGAVSPANPHQNPPRRHIHGPGRLL